MGVALGLALALVASACGSRATKSQIAEAVASRGGGGGRAGGGPAAGLQGQQAASQQNGSASNSGVGTGQGVNANTGSASGVSPGGINSGGGSRAGGTVSNAIPAPAGGNGGATDVGVTANSITATNISILTGPVPGLFRGAFAGTDAFFQFQNSQGGVYGRQLRVESRDDQFDCGQNKALTEEESTKVLAFVGSFSLFDDCGAQVFNSNANLVDVHSALAKGAQVVKNNFAPAPIKSGAPTGPFLYLKNKAPDAIVRATSLVGDVQSAKDSWTGEQQALEALGYKFVVAPRIYEPTETDFTADVIKWKANNVQAVVLIAADVKTIARVVAKEQEQNFRPKLQIFGASAYDNQLLQLATPAALEGAYIYWGGAMYLGEDRAVNPEVDAFLTWLTRYHADVPPDLFAAYGWASARLFVQALKDTGPRVTRAALLANLRKVTSFTANGLLAEADPADKVPSHCYIMIRLHNGKFTRDLPASGVQCDGQYFFAK